MLFFEKKCKLVLWITSSGVGQYSITTLGQYCIATNTYSHNVPLIGLSSSQHEGLLDKEMSFIEILPDSLVLSALKKQEKDENIILRFFNILKNNLIGKIKFYKKVKSAEVVSLNEKAVKDKKIKLIVEDNIIVVENIKRFQIITLLIKV